MANLQESGFRQDCEQLLNNFIDTGGLLFRNFTKEWQKMHFGLIFRGRPSVFEMIEFVEEAFLIAKSYLSADNPMGKRIGSLYLLYGIYYRQPTVNSRKQGFVKIRMEYQEWVSLAEMIKYLKEKGYIDVCYVYAKLIANNAFNLVCFSDVYGVDRLKLKMKTTDIASKKIEEVEKPLDSTLILEEILRDKNFTIPWRQKEMDYNRLKNLLKEEGILQSKKVKTTDFIDNILNDLDGSNKTETADDTLGERRRTLKNRTVAEANSVEQRRPCTLASFRDEMLRKIEEEKQKHLENISENKKLKAKNKSSKMKFRRTSANGAGLDVGNDNDDVDEDDCGDDDHDTNYLSLVDSERTDSDKIVTSLPKIIDSPSIHISYFSDVEEESDSESDSDSNESNYNSEVSERASSSGGRKKSKSWYQRNSMEKSESMDSLIFM